MWSRLLICALFLLPTRAMAGVKEKVAALAPAGLVLVVDAQGAELVAQNADQPFVPASVAKLVTAWLALESLGKDYRFETRFYLDNKRMLYVRGGGDPFLVSEELAMLAKELVAAIGKAPLAGIVLDASYYPADLRIPGIEDTTESYDALNSALAVNFNTIYAVHRGKSVTSAEKQTPITQIDATGITTTEDRFELDAIIFATGFDALTGALARIDIVGRGGEKLKDNWAHGPRSYLGLGVDGFPNMFLVNGPGAPAVLANMVLHAEAHVNWVADAISYVDANGYAAIEATTDSVNEWGAELVRRADTTLFPKANSWYMGANVPGKPRVFMLFIGGFAVYNDICADVAAAGYKGFELTKAS